MKPSVAIPTAQFLRTRLGKVCVAITGSTSTEMLDKASAATKETPFLEFRLDYLEKPLAALPKVKQFLADNTATIAIATCRRTSSGGKFEGDAEDEYDILAKAATAGCQLVDIAVESAEQMKRPSLDKLREKGTAVIVSFHDFNETGDLNAIYDRIEPLGADFIKIVPTANCLADNIKLMRFLERINDSDEKRTSVIGICMGDAGIISRVLGVRAGSAFTFAAATAGEETGPGQIAARTLIETYRIDEVDAATKVYGVAGNPIRNSLSPLMMNTAFRRETVNAVYLALQATDIADLLKLIQEVPLQGLSVTMPLKQEILQHLAHTDPLSAKIGAVNTILRIPDGKLYGFNTDVAGIVTPLEKRLPIRGTKVLVLGAGGAARAAVFALKDKGADVAIYNRSPEAAAKLAKQAGAKVCKRESLAKSQWDIIINATSVGMRHHEGEAAGSPLEANELNAKLVFDLVYNPIETPLLRLARQKGLAVISGVEMFIQQGARQFEIWTGKPAPEEEMLRVVLHALRQQQAEHVAGAKTIEEPVRSAAAAPEPAASPVKTAAPKATAAAAPARAAKAKAKK